MEYYKKVLFVYSRMYMATTSKKVLHIVGSRAVEFHLEAILRKLS